MSPFTLPSTSQPARPTSEYTLAGSSQGMEPRANQQSEPEREDRIDNCGINE